MTDKTNDNLHASAVIDDEEDERARSEADVKDFLNEQVTVQAVR